MIDMQEPLRVDTRERPVEMSDEDAEALLIAGIMPVAAPTETISTGGPLPVLTRRANVAQKVVMFSPQGFRKGVRAGDVAELFRDGWRRICPTCKQRHCGGVLGVPDEGLDPCHALPEQAFMRCPITSCGRIFHDRQLQDVADATRPNPTRGDEIKVDIKTSPKERLTLALRRHMLVRHPSESPSFGFYPDRPNANSPLAGRGR